MFFTKNIRKVAFSLKKSIIIILEAKKLKKTRIKFCGITSCQDALSAADAGADAIGLVFYPPSCRKVSISAARKIVRALPPFVTSVCLFVNATPDRVVSEATAVGAALVQLHGDEPPETVRTLSRRGLRVIKAFRIRQPDFADTVSAWLKKCRQSRPAAVLLDAYDPTAPGGTGRQIPLTWLTAARRAGKMKDWPPIILAGGLTPANVADTLRRFRPWAVDVSGGIESAPGKKNPSKMRRFIRAVK